MEFVFIIQSPHALKSMLSDEELNLLCDSAVGFGKAYRQANGICILYVVLYSVGSIFHKAHLVERHAPIIARRFETIDQLSEEGGELVHLRLKTAALMCRIMRDSAARIRASFCVKRQAGRRRIQARDQAKGCPLSSIDAQ